MPTNSRLDLALKYSNPKYAHRLADAVALWELCATLIAERESTFENIKKTVRTPQKTLSMLAEQTALMNNIYFMTKKIKHAMALTYAEIGDFVSLTMIN